MAIGREDKEQTKAQNEIKKNQKFIADQLSNVGKDNIGKDIIGVLNTLMNFMKMKTPENTPNIFEARQKMDERLFNVSDMSKDKEEKKDYYGRKDKIMKAKVSKVIKFLENKKIKNALLNIVENWNPDLGDLAGNTQKIFIEPFTKLIENNKTEWNEFLKAQGISGTNSTIANQVAGFVINSIIFPLIAHKANKLALKQSVLKGKGKDLSAEEINLKEKINFTNKILNEIYGQKVPVQSTNAKDLIKDKSLDAINSLTEGVHAVVVGDLHNAVLKEQGIEIMETATEDLLKKLHEPDLKIQREEVMRNFEEKLEKRIRELDANCYYQMLIKNEEVIQLTQADLKKGNTLQTNVDQTKSESLSPKEFIILKLDELINQQDQSVGLRIKVKEKEKNESEIVIISSHLSDSEKKAYIHQIEHLKNIVNKQMLGKSALEIIEAKKAEENEEQMARKISRLGSSLNMQTEKNEMEPQGKKIDTRDRSATRSLSLKDFKSALFTPQSGSDKKNLKKEEKGKKVEKSSKYTFSNK